MIFRAASAFVFYLQGVILKEYINQAWSDGFRSPAIAGEGGAEAVFAAIMFYMYGKNFILPAFCANQTSVARLADIHKMLPHIGVEMIEIFQHCLFADAVECPKEELFIFAGVIAYSKTADWGFEVDAKT